MPREAGLAAPSARLEWALVGDGEYEYEHPFSLLCPDLSPEEAAAWLGRHDCGPLNEQRWVSHYSCLLLRSTGQTVLVDTGCGSLGPHTGELMSSLWELGIASQEVDMVVLTHGHPDHVGGCLSPEGRPAFPNARYFMAIEEWEFWQSDPSLEYLNAPEEIRELMRRTFRENVPPLGDALTLVQGRKEIAPGIALLPAPGHTPGHMAVSFRRSGMTYVYASDAFLTPAHEERPHCRTAIDHDHSQAEKARRQLLREVENRSENIFGFHYPRAVLEKRMKT